MDDVQKYVFKIKGEYTIGTLPMSRLAEYMADLARMLGEPSKVHFVELVRSSIGLVHSVERDASPLVDARIDDIEQGTADVVHMDAYRALNKKLREDRSVGELQPVGRDARVLMFPGKDAPEPVKLSGVPGAGSIDGTIIRVGGTRDEIPVCVQSGHVVHARCVASKALAKELARFLFEGELRLYGQGKWARDEDGIWTLQRFAIRSFEPLDMTPLTSAVAELRAIEGADWASADDLWREAMEIRHGGALH
ncbi:hypothetical protein [Rhodocista pekingensis]|uniref:Uncharacterized protein n=1 Tax=Rhodocista pekingensis TaxID=201185 RepID=A0ABW2KXN4_9PROT